MKFKIFTKTFVVLNTADVIHEATIKRDTDFIGRPPFPRAEYVIKTDIAITVSNIQNRHSNHGK